MGIKTPKIPTYQQSKFVKELLVNGGDAKSALLSSGYTESSAKNPKRILASEAVQNELRIANDKLRAQIQIDFKYKYEKLKRVIDEYIPAEGELRPEHIKIAILAIAEMNKMAGDYAPDKKLNLTVDHTQSKLIEARKQYKEY